jgi:hypothetical protein
MTGNSTAAVGERKGRGPVVGPHVLDCAVLVALPYVMLMPFRLDRRPATYAVTDSTAEQRRRLAA